MSITSNIKRFGAALMSAMLIIGSAAIGTVPAYAATGVNSIVISYVVEDKAKPISGAEFSIAKVASQTASAYVMTDQYKTCTIDFTQVKSAQDVENAISTLEKISKNADQKQTTDNNGAITISNLDAGIYLVWQSGSSGVADDYRTADTMLEYIPLASRIDPYTLTIYPKTDKKSKPTPKDETITNPVPPQPSTPSNSVTQTIEKKKKNANSTTSSSSNPNTTTTTTTTTTSNQPSNPITTIVRNFKTGDASRIGLMAIILGGCVAVIAILAVGAVKKRKKK